MSVAGSALCASSPVWRSDAPVRRGVRFGFAIVLLCLIASVPATAGSRTWVYVALGDSNVYGAPNDCGHCTSYPLEPQPSDAPGGIRTLIENVNARTGQLATTHYALCVDDYHVFNGRHGTDPMPPGSFTARYGDLNNSASGLRSRRADQGASSSLRAASSGEESRGLHGASLGRTGGT
jgi:hypothetical protein